MRRKAFVLILSLTFALTGIAAYAEEDDILTNNGQYFSENPDGDEASDSLAGDDGTGDDGNTEDATGASSSQSSQVSSGDGSSSGTESSGSAGSSSGGSTGTASSGTGTTNKSSSGGSSSSSNKGSSTKKSTEADSSSASDGTTDQTGEAADTSLYAVSQDTVTDADSQDDSLGDKDGFQLIYDINIADSAAVMDSEEESEETDTGDHTRHTVDQIYESGSTEQALSIEEAFPLLEDTTDNGMGYQDQYRKFVRWNTEPDGSGATLDPEEEMVFSDHDIILYAIWTKMDLTMSVDVDGDGAFDDEGAGIEVGDNVTYRIAYTNGYDSAVSLTVTEELDEGLTFVSSESASYDEETRTLTCYRDYVESGTDGTLEFTAAVNEDAVEKSEIESVASVRVGDDPTVATNRVKNWVPIEITVSAVWDDNEDEEEIRPESIQIQLLADGENSKDPVELNGENSWTFTWKDLPYESDGKKITYTVEGEPVEGYDQTYGEMKDLGEGKFSITLTNEFVSATVRISGSVTWIDVSEEKDYSSKRPEEMTVHLYANGEKVKNLTLTEEDGWEWNVSGLDKYDEDGIPITYTVTADTVKDYVTEIEGYEITNSYSPYKMNLNVQLIWDDTGDEDGIRPESAAVELLENGEKTGDTLTLDASNSFSGCFTDLDEYTNGENIEYTVEVSPISGYKTFVTEERDTNCVILRSVPLTDAEAETEDDLTDDAVDTGDDIHWWSFLLG